MEPYNQSAPGLEVPPLELLAPIIRQLAHEEPIDAICLGLTSHQFYHEVPEVLERRLQDLCSILSRCVDCLNKKARVIRWLRLVRMAAENPDYWCAVTGCVASACMPRRIHWHDDWEELMRRLHKKSSPDVEATQMLVEA